MSGVREQTPRQAQTGRGVTSPPRVPQFPPQGTSAAWPRAAFPPHRSPGIYKRPLTRGPGGELQRCPGDVTSPAVR